MGTTFLLVSAGAVNFVSDADTWSVVSGATGTSVEFPFFLEFRGVLGFAMIAYSFKAPKI